jgi:hypothetical protein
MKIIELIEVLRAHPKDAEITGVEHLRISAPVVATEPPPPPTVRKTKLTRQNRIDCATDPRDIEVVARNFGVSPDYVLHLRTLLRQNKIDVG